MVAVSGVDAEGAYTDPWKGGAHGLGDMGA